jgi:phage terminase large subunit
MIIGAQKGQGSVTRGIDFVKDQKISVTKRSLNIIKEYRNYLFITDRDGKILNVPEGGFDHAMDAIRYGLSKYKETPDRSAYTKAIQQYLHPESESPRQVPQKQLKYSKRKSF